LSDRELEKGLCRKLSGPPAKKLSQLFRLKYIEGVTEKEELAGRLGVKLDCIYVYENRLKRKLVAQGIIKLEPVKKTLQVVDEDRFQFVCPECLSARLYPDPESGERTCGACGYVMNADDGQDACMDESLGFNTTYALESSMAIGKSLGSSPAVRDTYKILAVVNKDDLGLRARQIRIMSETNEHPRLAELLRLLYELSKRYGVDGDKIFNNDVATNLRRAFWLTREIDLKVTKRALAESVFWFTTCQYGKGEIAAKAKMELLIDPKVLHLIIKTGELIHTAKTFRASMPEGTESVITELVFARCIKVTDSGIIDRSVAPTPP
jgi:hypothetical protein